MNHHPIGILGGTFDPIHLGHLHLATKIYQLCKLQKILLIPCYQSPLKPPPIAGANDRLKMIQLAIKDLPFLEIDRYEIDNPTISYTVNTLEYLHQKNSTTPLALIMGIDAFDRFDEWHEWQRILQLSHLIVVNRPGYQQTTSEEIKKVLVKHQTFNLQELQTKTAGLIYQVAIDPLPIASTEIRNLIMQQKDVSRLVSKEVWQYMQKHKLYS